MTLTAWHSKFWEIAQAKGSASQDKKQAIIQALIVASRPQTNDAGVIIRALLVSPIAGSNSLDIEPGCFSC